MAAGARLDWQLATVAMFRDDTPTVRSITFDVPAWMGHSPGQHVDIRLTAENGYQAQRSYSIASAAGQDTRIELTVERLANGEVSPFLTQELVVGDSIELRGPIGGYFNWNPDHSAPLMLIGGGSGVVPNLRSSCVVRRRSSRSSQINWLRWATRSQPSGPSASAQRGRHLQELLVTRFMTYRDSFPNARLTRSKSGVLEVILHTSGDTLVFNGHVHE
jgi:ferredoxin-NADP reductase